MRQNWSPPTPTLHVFHDDVNWVVAETPDEAYAIIIRDIGYDEEEAHENEFIKLGLDDHITVSYDVDDFLPDALPDSAQVVVARPVLSRESPAGLILESGTVKVTATAEAWASKAGKGVLASTEF